MVFVMGTQRNLKISIVWDRKDKAKESDFWTE